MPQSIYASLQLREEHVEAAEIFAGTGVNVTVEGKRYLGVALGTRSFVESYVMQKLVMWESEIEKLSNIAKSQPHAAYSALTKGLSSR